MIPHRYGTTITGRFEKDSTVIPTNSQVDVMIDIETLGIGPRAAFFEIGYSTFHPFDADSTINMGMIQFDVMDVIMCGGEVDADTIKWWRTQPKPKRANSELLSARDGLSRFSDFFAGNDVRFVWANSPKFDCQILESMYVNLGMEVPWTYKQLLDVRTARRLLEQMGFKGPLMEETIHRADKDSMDQAIWLSAALSELASHIDPSRVMVR